MAWLMSGDFASCGDEDAAAAQRGIERCPFLRNINKPTNFSFGNHGFPVPVSGAKGPIFEDEPNFDMAFRLFHGKDGVVPLLGRQDVACEKVESEPAPVPFNPLAAKAATISLSAFGFGSFGFDDFSEKRKKRNKNVNRKDQSSQGNKNSSHESLSNEWLMTGQCPLAKSYRAVNGILPLVAKALKPPPGVVLKCPKTVVAIRAALARTALVKQLRPQPLPAKMLAIAMLGMACNVPLGVWREHTQKFSPQWFVAVHAAVPFIGMLRKSVQMPKTAMAITLAASILGQTLGARAERLRLKAASEADSKLALVQPSHGAVQPSHGLPDVGLHGTEEKLWQPLKAIPEGSSAAKAEVCF